MVWSSPVWLPHPPIVKTCTPSGEFTARPHRHESPAEALAPGTWSSSWRSGGPTNQGVVAGPGMNRLSAHRGTSMTKQLLRQTRCSRR